jgi:hypothetical protein
MSNESAMTTIPENTNFLQRTKFTFIIPNLPFAKYFCQTVTMPGVATNEVMVPTPFVDTYRHGDKLQYEPLMISFLIDEDFRVWEETYNWIKSLTVPHNFNEYRRFKNQKVEAYYDGILTFNNNANRPNFRVKFIGCHPTSLSAVDMSVMENADSTPTALLSFRYQYFDIERNS